MGADREEERVFVDSTRRPFYWYLMVAGLVVVAYFTLTMVINMVYGVDLAGKGVNVVRKEPVVEENKVVREAEVSTLHGASGWVAVFAPWLALNSEKLVLGVALFALGYVMVAKKRKDVAVSVFKARLLSGYLLIVSLMLLVLGLDRVYFLPHAQKEGALAWIDWYVFEFLAHIVWGLVLTVFAIFFARARGGKEAPESVSAG